MTHAEKIKLNQIQNDRTRKQNVRFQGRMHLEDHELCLTTAPNNVKSVTITRLCLIWIQTFSIPYVYRRD